MLCFAVLDVLCCLFVVWCSVMLCCCVVCVLWCVVWCVLLMFSLWCVWFVLFCRADALMCVGVVCGLCWFVLL